MRTLLCALLALPLLAGPKVKLTTNLGPIVFELQPDAAPRTVESFLVYVRRGQYNGTIFHRVVKAGGIVQGGGHTPTMAKRKTLPPTPHEGEQAKAKGLKHLRGTVALALPPGMPTGGTAQFFINVKNNPSYDFKAKTLQGYGYTPFAKVVEGMAVVDKIAASPVKGERPVKDVIIEKAEEVK